MRELIHSKSGESILILDASECITVPHVEADYGEFDVRSSNDRYISAKTVK